MPIIFVQSFLMSDYFFAARASTCFLSASISALHFSIIFSILRIFGFEFRDFPALVVNDRCHFRFGIFYILIALSKFHREAAVHHIAVIPHGPAQVEHGPFVGAIEESHSSSGGITVIAYAGCEIPLIIRIEVQRMKGSQQGSAGAYLINAVPSSPTLPFR